MSRGSDPDTRVNTSISCRAPPSMIEAEKKYKYDGGGGGGGGG